METKEISPPWLDYIMDGSKTYEGRLNKGFWKKLKIGDTFIFDDATSTYPVEVVSLAYFQDFASAYKSLKTQLVPNQLLIQSFLEVYQQEQLDNIQKTSKKLEAYQELMEKPIGEIEAMFTEKVRELYRKYFSDADVKKYGVVCVEVIPYTKSKCVDPPTFSQKLHSYFS